MIFGEVNNVIAIFDRFINAWKRRKTKAVRSVPRRFVELFESHGVLRNQIPRFFGHGITLSDLADDGLLLSKLNETVLDAACTLFAVRREWFDEMGEDPYFRHDFYKSPQDFVRFLDELQAANPGAELSGYLIFPVDDTPEVQVVLILAEAIGSVGDTIIYRHHICDNWSFGYWKSRAYLTACVAIAWKRGVFVKGRYADQREFSAITQQHALLGRSLNRLVLQGRRWYAEDIALLPDEYLKGLDPEKNKFGVVSALRLWLQLDDDGWMDTGLKKEIRPEFEAELAKYDSVEQT